jgi:hypothetical protein
MAHFAELDENNVVVNVVVVGDEYADTYTESRATFGEKYIQTSYNTYRGVHRLGGTPLRKNYAVIGGTYDEARDAFITIQPFPSWILDEETCDWMAPIPKPNETSVWKWDETNQGWIELTPPAP